MEKLITKPNLPEVDAIYQRLIYLHEGRDEMDSQRTNARLILILLNHIGDAEVAREAIELACSTGQAQPQN